MMVQAFLKQQEETKQELFNQREETKQELQAFVEQQKLENEQYRLSIQKVIATQFTSLSQTQMQNLQQAQVNFLGVVANLIIYPQQFVAQPQQPAPQPLPPNIMPPPIHLKHLTTTNSTTTFTTTYSRMTMMSFIISFLL